MDSTGHHQKGHILIQIVSGKGFTKYLTTRAIIIHGPVQYSETNVEELGKALKLLKRTLPWYTLFIQFRNLSNDERLAHAFRKAGFRFYDRLNLCKKISPLEDAWNELSESKRRQIRQSRTNGLEIIRNPARSEVLAFYSILQGLYKRIVKPLPSVAFFMKFYELSLSGEIKGFISLARYQGKIVGGIVCPYDNTGRVYEYYICGLDKELAPNKVYPSVALTWDAMLRGAELGCRYFDFMGLGVPSKPYGVRDFKLRFGGKVENPGRWNKIHNPVLYFLAEIVYNIKIWIQRILLF
ncbi:MAG: peptidoglycan bridge formation glycyltransferase FemA/FemB family protein [Bacteroidales bacterium]